MESLVANTVTHPSTECELVILSIAKVVNAARDGRLAVTRVVIPNKRGSTAILALVSSRVHTFPKSDRRFFQQLWSRAVAITSTKRRGRSFRHGSVVVVTETLVFEILKEKVSLITQYSSTREDPPAKATSP
jgi:hypothetical protein